VTCIDFHPVHQILASGSLDFSVKFFEYSKPSVKKAYKSIQVGKYCNTMNLSATLLIIINIMNAKYSSKYRSRVSARKANCILVDSRMLIWLICSAFSQVCKIIFGFFFPENLEYYWFYKKKKKKIVIFLSKKITLQIWSEKVKKSAYVSVEYLEGLLSCVQFLNIVYKNPKK